MSGNLFKLLFGLPQGPFKENQCAFTLATNEIEKELKLSKNCNDVFVCQDQMEKSSLTCEIKHPTLINSNYPTDVHISNKHAGQKQTLLLLRQKFWIFRNCSFV